MDKHFYVVAVLVLAVHYAYPCCFPKQFEGLAGISMGHDEHGAASAAQALLKMSFDFVNKKVYLEGSAYSKGQTYKEQILQDYTSKKQYVVVEGKCTVMSLPLSLLMCIPSDAKKVLSSYYGVDSNKLDFDMYTFMYEEIQTTLSVLKENCVPIAEHMETNTAIVDTGYMGITLGIKNTTVFNIPTACQKTMTFSSLTPGLQYLKQRRQSIFFRH